MKKTKAAVNSNSETYKSFIPKLKPRKNSIKCKDYFKEPKSTKLSKNLKIYSRNHSKESLTKSCTNRSQKLLYNQTSQRASSKELRSYRLMKIKSAASEYMKFTKESHKNMLNCNPSQGELQSGNKKLGVSKKTKPGFNIRTARSRPQIIKTPNLGDLKVDQFTQYQSLMNLLNYNYLSEEISSQNRKTIHLEPDIKDNIIPSTPSSTTNEIIPRYK